MTKAPPRPPSPVRTAALRSPRWSTASPSFPRPSSTCSCGSRTLAEREAELRTTDPLDRMLEFDCRNLLVDQILNYADVLAMAHSLEIRTPYLDHRLVDFVFSVPSSLKIRDGETKWLLKQVAARYLPDELVARRKEGFVEPSVYWIQKELRDFCREQFVSAGFNALGLLDADYARALVNRFYAAPTFEVAKKVWCLLMYALWERMIVGP